MLDFKVISTMNVNEFLDFTNQLDDKTIFLNRDVLNFINGFILCKSLCKYNMSEEQLSNIFYAFLKGNNIKELEKLFKKS